MSTASGAGSADCALEVGVEPFLFVLGVVSQLIEVGFRRYFGQHYSWLLDLWHHWQRGISWDSRWDDG